jgi:hypothetical protein
MLPAPRQDRVVRVAEARVCPAVRCRRHFTDGQLHRADVSNRDEPSRGANPELDIDEAGLIGRIAIHKHVLPVQLNPTGASRVDLFKIPLELQRNTARSETRVYRRDGSRRSMLQGYAMTILV